MQMAAGDTDTPALCEVMGKLELKDREVESQ